MPPSYASTSSRILKNILDTLVITPVALVIVAAVLIATASMFENLRVGKVTNQIVILVGAARDFSTREQSFTTQTSEDILATLAHAGLIASIMNVGSIAQVTNPWQRDITATAPAPYNLRVETEVPPEACRHLAFFFSGQASDLGLLIMETRVGRDGSWRRFYDKTNQSTAEESMIQAACAQGAFTNLALIFKLRQ